MLQETVVRTPKAIITKALYSKLLRLEQTSNEADLDSDYSVENLSDLLNRFIFHYGQPPGISKVDDFKILRKEFAIALRHREDYYELCLEVARQSLEKGLPYVTFGVSEAARMLKSVCKEILVEINRSKSLRFHPHPQNRSVYWAEFNIFHKTADIILNYFAKRYPVRTLVIYSRREVYWLYGGQVFSQEISRFSLGSIDPKFSDTPYYAVR